MEFLSDAALSAVKDTLGSDFDESLGPAATWADEIKGISGAPYAWASALHYVDALDNPPDECSVDYDRDCEGDRCIREFFRSSLLNKLLNMNWSLVGAISNYTTRLVDPDLDPDQIQEALKFLDHVRL
jgi:hypothetical protein